MTEIEMRHRLPGANSVSKNVERWNGWDWGQLGEEWTVSQEWKQALIDDVLLRYIEPAGTVLEIGPGGGRWSEPLQKIADRLILVDLSERCIEICRERFAQAGNVQFHVNDGSSMPFLADASVDYVWSFDVFVHVSPVETRHYLQEINRVLRDRGRAVIHHGSAGSSYELGWRSATTTELFLDMLKKNGLQPVSQFDSWGPNGQFDVRHYRDVITVFEKTATQLRLAR
jgi:ubiquinone/menaquinone biosynthesis C-methylase UbiE